MILQGMFHVKHPLQLEVVTRTDKGLTETSANAAASLKDSTFEREGPSLAQIKNPIYLYAAPFADSVAHALACSGYLTSP
jgi:hypothetical protein